MKQFYQRKFPHIQPLGATFFFTFHLENSIPKSKVKSIMDDFELFTRLNKNKNEINTETENNYYNLINKYDKLIHTGDCGPYHLKNEIVAKLVCNAFYYHDQTLNDLLAFCVMFNHVHVVLTPLQIEHESYVPLEKITHSIKSFTANEANKILDIDGQFWAHESFDNYCRSNAHILKFVNYTLSNPVKAGLVQHWQDWKWSYCKKSLKFQA